MISLKDYEKVVSNRRYYPIAFRVLDQKGKIIFSSAPLSDLSFPKVFLDHVNYQKPLTTTLNVLFEQGTIPFQLCTYFYREGGELKYIVQIATPLRTMHKSIENFRDHLFIAFFLALFFGSMRTVALIPANPEAY